VFQKSQYSHAWNQSLTSHSHANPSLTRSLSIVLTLTRSSLSIDLVPHYHSLTHYRFVTHYRFLSNSTSLSHNIIGSTQFQLNIIGILIDLLKVSYASVGISSIVLDYVMRMLFIRIKIPAYLLLICFCFLNLLFDWLYMTFKGDVQIWFYIFHADFFCYLEFWFCRRHPGVY
jgi:hypothetical protein